MFTRGWAWRALEPNGISAYKTCLKKPLGASRSFGLKCQHHAKSINSHFSGSPHWNSLSRKPRRSLQSFHHTREYSFIPGIEFNSDEDEGKDKKDGKESGGSRAKDIFIKCMESAGITLASLSMLALAGLGYQEFYQKSAVSKIEDAFKTGDPAFALSVHSNRTGELEGW